MNERNLSRRHFVGAGLAAAVGLAFSTVGSAATGQRRVVVWSEGTAPADKVYPKDINGAVADGLRKYLKDWTVDIAGLKDTEQGCSAESLNQCDVLIWWGHKLHDSVKDEYVARIVKRVREEGMGFIAVHSSHFAKANKALMGTPCSWAAYKNDGCKMKIKVDLNHPITKGVSDFVLPQIERYSEPYAVPDPESVPLQGTYVYPDGKEEPARMGLCWVRGKGRMFYFAPGHETYQDFYMEPVRRIMANAVEWAAPRR